MPTPVERYERRYPDTGVGEAQKQERAERLVFKDERRAHVRTSRNRGIVVSSSAPWPPDRFEERHG